MVFDKLGKGIGIVTGTAVKGVVAIAKDIASFPEGLKEGLGLKEENQNKKPTFASSSS